MADLRHAGLHWNNGPSKDARLYALPSPVILMLSTEARYRSADAFTRGKQLVYRAVPRVGHRPAELKYNASKIADECMLLWNEQPHDPAERLGFQPLCEQTLNYERGDNEDDFQNLDARHARLARMLSELEPALRARLPVGTRLHFPPWVPDGRAYDRLDIWRDVANQYDVISEHEYGPPEGILERIQWHLDTWPTKGVFLSEWHNDEPERTLQLLAELAAREPRFLGATWFIGHWYDAPSDWPKWKNLQDNDDLYATFMHPPVVAQPAPLPVPVPIPPVEPPMPTPDPFEFWAAEAISQATTVEGERMVSVADAELYWPKIHAQLVECGIADRPVQMAAIATTAVESSMRPIHEYGTPADWAGYSGGAAFAGRGFIQLTHDYNYRQYGEYLAELWGHTTPPDMLVNIPDLALDPDIAAAVLALYFVHHTTLQGYSIPAAARAGDWEWVRRLVQGGVVGLPRLIAIAGALGGTPVPVPTPLPYDPDAKIDVQPDDWSCSVQSTQWLLRSIGRNPGDDWMEQQLVPSIVSKDVGLLDASGNNLAAWVNREYGAEMGFIAYSAPVTFDDVLAGAGTNPTIVGGRHYGPGGHWVGIRRADENGLLELANPAPNYTNTGTHLDRGEWDARGPWSAIYIDRGAVAPAPPAPTPIPVPDPTPVPQPSRATVLVGEIRTRLEELAGLVA